MKKKQDIPSIEKNQYCTEYMLSENFQLIKILLMFIYKR